MYGMGPFIIGVLGAVLGYVHLGGLEAYSGGNWKNNSNPTLVLIFTVLASVGISYAAFLISQPTPLQLQFGISGFVFCVSIWKRYTTLYYSGKSVVYALLIGSFIWTLITGLFTATSTATGSSKTRKPKSSGGSSKTQEASADHSSDEDLDEEEHHFLIRWAYEEEEEDD